VSRESILFTPKALANYSPGLAQPWDSVSYNHGATLKELRGCHRDSLAMTQSRSRIATLSELRQDELGDRDPRVVTTLGYN